MGYGMDIVILESPYAGDIERNEKYARECMLHSLKRGEAPMVSHLLYTQVLDDNDFHERALGIEAGLAWREVATKSVVYVDYGISNGMKHGIDKAKQDGKEIEFRRIY